MIILVAYIDQIISKGRALSNDLLKTQISFNRRKGQSKDKEQNNLKKQHINWQNSSDANMMPYDGSNTWMRDDNSTVLVVMPYDGSNRPQLFEVDWGNQGREPLSPWNASFDYHSRCSTS